MLRYGIISDIDAAAGKARVHFTEDDIVSDWLPILVPKAMSDSFSFFPDINEHVACMMDENCENGVVMGSIYNSESQPNGGNKDKYRARFSDGTEFEYDRAAHKLYASVKGQVEVKADGAIKVDGQSTVDVLAQGNVNVQTSANATVQATAVTIDAPNTTCTGIFTCAQLVVGSGGNASVAGSLSVSGSIHADGNIDGAEVKNAANIALGTHKHTGVVTGGGTTATPIP